MRFLGKKIIVTGGGRGIGAACARAFAAEGAKVLVVARTLGELEKVSRGHAAAIFPLAVDLSNPKSVDRIFKYWKGPIDGLVNNAATLISRPVLKMTVKDWDHLIDVNLRAPYFLAQQAARRMKKNGGFIINVSSLGGIQGTQKFPGLSAYTTSKAGLIGMTESLATELSSLRIRVNAIAPGAVSTKMLKKAAPTLRTETLPEHIAEHILLLAEKDVSGEVMTIHSNL